MPAPAKISPGLYPSILCNGLVDFRPYPLSKSYVLRWVSNSGSDTDSNPDSDSDSDGNKPNTAEVPRLEEDDSDVFMADASTHDNDANIEPSPRDEDVDMAVATQHDSVANLAHAHAPSLGDTRAENGDNEHVSENSQSTSPRAGELDQDSTKDVGQLDMIVPNPASTDTSDIDPPDMDKKEKVKEKTKTKTQCADDSTSVAKSSAGHVMT
ncbi:hypothetical protein V5O48_015478 [Marasmius crinis-equi]|uniref:Uncharacterized protein n=1 Tax=Marasmius crinis-equi TaxID=585013 RepID=A0ABR3EUE6_9AGAR